LERIRQGTEMAKIDHVILKVNDIAASVAFYVGVMGFGLVGQQGPFTVVRVDEDFVLQLAPWGTGGNEHLAFALGAKEFKDTFARIKERGIPYGDSFHKVGNNEGPGVEAGARGDGSTIYLNDPNKHLIEIRTYARDTDAR
jgi:catechol 2,3-dioxygenase-like lactoylglutathione lyase family enzyme